MSMTVTQTITVEQAAPVCKIIRVQHVKHEPRVRLLLEKMQKAARQLPHKHQEEVLEIIKEWEHQFFSTYHIDSHVDSERVKAAHALLFLRLNNIEYIMFNYAADDIEKVTWLQIYNELKDIVVAVLPPEIDVEAFVEADRQKQLECQLRYKTDQTIREVMQKVGGLFAKLEQELYESADRINQNLQVEFEAIKKLLFDLNKERSAEANGFHEEVDRLTEVVNQIYQDLERQLNETRELGEKICIQEDVLEQLSGACEAIISKV